MIETMSSYIRWGIVVFGVFMLLRLIIKNRR